MNIVGITFNRELQGYVDIRAIKISKWIDHTDFSLDVIFRLTIEHKHKEGGFKKVKELFVYFPEEDLRDITIDFDAIELERKRLEESQAYRSKEHELEEKISPFEGYIYPIITKNIIIEEKKENNRINIGLEDYDITEWTKKRNIFFSLRFKRSIATFYVSESIEPKIPWSYDCSINPHLVQTLKWNKKEFMPSIRSLEIWLQVPKELYGSVSAINIQPESHLEQMFLLGKEIAEIFRKTGQPLAQEETLCINWQFCNVSISDPPERVEVTCRLRQSELEADFVRRFEESPEKAISILREILYVCKIQTLDFKYIVSGISNRNLKEVLEVFNIIVFRKNLRSMKDNLNLLVELLDNFREFPHGEEFFCRYDIFLTLINCTKSEDFFSKSTLSKLRKTQKLEYLLDPNYVALFQDCIVLAELTERFHYIEVLSRIDKLIEVWGGKLIHSDRQILSDILVNWKYAIKKEFEEKKVRKPEIEASIKTKYLALDDEVGIVISIKNIGEGKARDVCARLIQADDYDIVVEKSETRTFLDIVGRPYEPELVIKPKDDRKAVISYEIYYKDLHGRSSSNRFEESVEFIKREIPFRKIQNPYIIGQVVTESKMLFGREELIQNIIDTFRGKYSTNPLFLYGQRRTGKTSILFHLKKRLENEFAPVFFTTLVIFGKRSFYEDLMKRIKKELGLTDFKIPNIDDDPFNEFKSKFYDPLKERLKGRKIVLMIDEYQRIDELIAKGHYDDTVIDFLNALVEDGEINAILAGFLQPEELSNSKWEVLMRHFATINISFLRREDVIKLICEPVKGVIEYDKGGIEKIISLSGCHPYFVQLICHTMVEHHNHDQISLIGSRNVTKHLFGYFGKGINVFSDIIFSQTQGVERNVLLCLCNLMEKREKTSIHKSEIEEFLIERDETIGLNDITVALTHLEKREIVRKSAEHRDYYSFAIDLYRNWVKWNLPEKFSREERNE